MSTYNPPTKTTNTITHRILLPSPPLPRLQQPGRLEQVALRAPVGDGVRQPLGHEEQRRQHEAAVHPQNVLPAGADFVCVVCVRVVLGWAGGYTPPNPSTHVNRSMDPSIYIYTTSTQHTRPKRQNAPLRRGGVRDGAADIAGVPRRGLRRQRRHPPQLREEFLSTLGSGVYGGGIFLSLGFGGLGGVGSSWSWMHTQAQAREQSKRSKATHVPIGRLLGRGHGAEGLLLFFGF